MKPQTSMAIIRAGLALREAIQLAREDRDAPRQLALVLSQLDKVADKLVDVPVPRDYLDDAPAGPSRKLRCPSCGVDRIITRLSDPLCPRCGTRAEL